MHASEGPIIHHALEPPHGEPLSTSNGPDLEINYPGHKVAQSNAETMYGPPNAAYTILVLLAMVCVLGILLMPSRRGLHKRSMWSESQRPLPVGGSVGKVGIAPDAGPRPSACKGE